MMKKLTLDQMVYTAPTAGVNSKVLSYKVPLNSYMILDDNQLMRLKITAKQTFTFNTTQSASTTVTVSGSVATVGNIYTGNTDYNKSAIGYWKGTSQSTQTLVKPSAISGTSITFPINDSTDSGGTLVVYYTLKPGSYSWVVNAPTAASTISASVLKDAVSNVNSLNQASTETGLFFPRKILMTEHFDLQLWVLAPVVVDMDPASLSTDTPNLLAAVDIPVSTGEMATLLERDPEVKKTAVHLLQAGN